MTAVELELVDGRQRVRKRGNLYNLFLKLHYFHENTANRICIFQEEALNVEIVKVCFLKDLFL